MLKDKNILVAMSGGIAAYKIADLVSRLRKQAANVKVVMTEGATEFITPLTMETMSGQKVYIDVFGETEYHEVEHIELAKWADVVVVAPATANTMAKLVYGLADNMLTTCILATRAPILVVPAMNTQMFLHQATQENMEKLVAFGYHVMETAEGKLACGDVGKGKMPEPQQILEEIEYVLTEKDLEGKKFIVTAGPTMEPLDPVRYVTNHSSGKMGYAIAREAYLRGADVTLVQGYTTLPAPKVSRVVPVKTTIEMLEAIDEYFDDADVLIKAAAPADYRSAEVSDVKIKKENQDQNEMVMTFVENPDIAKYFGEKKRDQIIVGFAAETHKLEKHALGKLKKKKLDFIVANDVAQSGAGFKSDTNIVTIYDADGGKEEYPQLAKTIVAKTIVDRIAKKWK